MPGTDPYENLFPRLLHASNNSLWLVWQKFIANLNYSQIYLMVNNGYGWTGQTPVVNSGGAYDDLAPALTQLANGTIFLVWSRGGHGAAGCFSSTYQLYTESYTNNKWSSPTPLTQSSASDITPALARLSDGRVMLVWSRCTLTNGYGDLYYKIFNGTWGPEAAIPTASSPAYEEKLPSITQTQDGRVWVAYSSNSGGVNQVWTTIWNGITWSSSAQLTNTSNSDDWPSIAQDRNGTIWAFWARNLPNGTVNGVVTTQYDLFYKNSTSNGVSWSPDQTIFPNINSEDQQPFVIQNSDKKLWLVYSSDQKLGNPYGSPNLYLAQSEIVKIHDLGVASISVPAIRPRSGEIVNGSVTVANLGDYRDSPQVNYSVNSSYTLTQSSSINPGQNKTFNFSWNSAGQKAGLEVAKGWVTVVPGQVVTGNTSLNTTFLLFPRGDVDRDGSVDLTDLILIASHFGSTPGTSHYYPEADLDKDGIIDLTDIILCASDFGEFVRPPVFALVLLRPPSPNPRLRETVFFAVTVSNKGAFTGSANVNLYVNRTLAGTLPVTVPAGQNTTLTLSWNSTGHIIGRYQANATVVPVGGGSPASYTSTFLLVPRGDVNRDGNVDLTDLIIIASHFGTVQGGSNFVADADLDKDGIINLSDLIICAADFGKAVS